MNRAQHRRELEPNYLAKDTIRFNDPDSGQRFDVGPGTWLRKIKKTISGEQVGYEGKVVRVDFHARSVRFDQGLDPNTGENLNDRLEFRTKWEQVVSFEGDKVFYEIIPDPTAAPPAPPETVAEKRARLMAEIAGLDAEPGAEPAQTVDDAARKRGRPRSVVE